LKIAVVLVLGFQFVIFFRYIDLDAQMISIDDELKTFQDDQKVFVNIQRQLNNLQDDLERGKGRLSERLQNLPSRMRTQIVGLGKDLAEMRSGKSSEHGSSTPSLMIQRSIQSPAPKVNTLIAHLSDLDREELSTANTMDPRIQSIMKRVVERGIIAPLFLALNKDKDRLLTEPFAEKKKLVSVDLQNRGATLQKYGAKPGEIEEALNRVQGQLQSLRLTPPQSDRWWRTVPGKTGMSKSLDSVTDQALHEISQELRSQQRRLDLPSSNLTQLVQEIQARKALVASQMLEVQDRSKVVQDQLQGLAKPLSVIAVEPREAVLYYPLILAGLVVYFIGRYLWIGWRTLGLAAGYQQLGASEQALQVSFAGFPKLWRTRRYSDLSTWLVLTLSLAPGALLAVSFRHIWSRPDLMKDAPVRLYQTAIVCCVLACAVLIGSSFRPTVGLGRKVISKSPGSLDEKASVREDIGSESSTEIRSG
jgi:hypothetical protein